MRRFLCSFVVALMLTQIGADVVYGQERTLTQPARHSARCAVPADTARLRVTLPLDVLDHLERVSTSIFAHAFLVHLIADTAAGNHRLARCARALENIPLTRLNAVRDSLPDARSILEALRAEELTRQRIRQFADSVRDLDAYVRLLRNDTSTASLTAARAYLAEARRISPMALRSPLESVLTRIDSLAAGRNRLAAVRADFRQAGAAVALARSEYAATEERLTADTLHRRRLSESREADPAELVELQARIDSWKEMLQLRGAERDTADSLVVRTERALAEARTAVDAQHESLDNALRVLQQAMLSPDAAFPHHLTVADGTRLTARITSVVAPVMPAAPSAERTSRAPNILLELTDFVIARARHEAVNSFVINLHRQARREPLPQVVFPDTWGLMRGIPVRSDTTLDARSVGRIPLSAWRSTLGRDFVALPVNLLEAAPSS